MTELVFIIKRAKSNVTKSWVSTSCDKIIILCKTFSPGPVIEKEQAAVI